MANKAEKSVVQKFIEDAPTGKGDTVTYDHVEQWCIENSKEQWLFDYDDSHNKFTFFQLRKAFYMEFFPDRISSKPKKKTMKSRIEALRAQKAL